MNIMHAYPDQEAYAAGHLQVGNGHALYYELWGNPRGLPALLLHGGPGSGSSPSLRRWFDPARYRVLSFDQRGAGHSSPRGETRHNHTALLLEDIDLLCERFALARPLVVGGSWGASLAAAWAARRREAVAGVLLRGLFLCGKADLAWFFQGAAALFPQQWEAFAATAPKTARRDLLGWFARRYPALPAAQRAAIALACGDWERCLAGLPALSAPPSAEQLAAQVDRLQVQVHYLARRCWLDQTGVLQACARLHGVPVLLLHGARDLVCRPQGAWRAHRSLHGSCLRWIADAGHDPLHPDMAAAMRAALDGFAATGRWV